MAWSLLQVCLLVVVFIWKSPTIASAPTLSSFVDPLIGTGGEGFGVGGDPPGTQVPFGACRASPDTTRTIPSLESNHYGGYHIDDDMINCFGHTHMVGPGVSDYGNIGIMPAAHLDPKTISDYGYRSRFSHKKENAQPGWYHVFLETPNVEADLTSCGSHTAIHKYQFLGDLDRKFVVFNPSHSLPSGRILNASVSIGANGVVSGWGLMHGALTERNGKGVNVYFAAKTDTPVESYGVWKEKELHSNVTSMKGVQIGAYLQFTKDSSAEVSVSVAISFISVAQAKKNLEVQAGNQTFATCLAATTSLWETTLSTVTVNFPTDLTTEYEEELSKFYTALYHSFMAPTKFSEVDGVYLGMDNKVHTIEHPVEGYYTDMSIWDIHRTQMPLLTLLFPNRTRDILQSLVSMYKEGGDLPRWPIANVFAGCMIGTHANIMLLDGYAKNVSGIDIKTAYEGMRLQATDPNRPQIGREGLSDYIQYGYVPHDKHGKAASLTLAYAYDDWALGTLATLLGNTNDSKVFLNRSQWYRHIWDDKNEFMCPKKSDQSFACQAVPELHSWIYENSGFCEGDQEEYRWFVPHDVPGLVSLFKSPEDYAEKLQRFFELTEFDSSTLLPNPYYWAGNEPGLLEPFQFNFAGRADLTQKFSRHVMKHTYSTKPDGLPGNDDFGALSAWYVWAAMGMYPISGNTTYILGSPVFENVTVHLDNGPLNIISQNHNFNHVHVEKVEVNGKAVDVARSAFIDHSDIANGGVMTFWMTA